MENCSERWFLHRNARGHTGDLISVVGVGSGQPNERDEPRAGRDDYQRREHP